MFCCGAILRKEGAMASESEGVERSAKGERMQKRRGKVLHCGKQSSSAMARASAASP